VTAIEPQTPLFNSPHYSKSLLCSSLHVFYNRFPSTFCTKLSCKKSSVGMDPPPLPSSSGRFRIRVQIIAPEYAHNLTADPLRQFTIVKNPNLPLPDLTLRHLCNEVVKRYENLYPGERWASRFIRSPILGSFLYASANNLFAPLGSLALKSRRTLTVPIST
jgi:hypothetical protein